MENAVDAIKIAFGLLVFAIAITFTFSVIGQARATSDVLFRLNDKTEFYEYATQEDYNAIENRIVGFETILPTIHRYAKEQYAVTIFNINGEPIVRYDLYTEGFMGNWNEVLKNKNSYNFNIANEAQRTYEEVKTRLEQVQKVVNKELNTNIDIMKFVDTNLYRGKVQGSSNVNIVAPWMGNPDEDTVYRINCDMITNGFYTKEKTTYYGKNLKQYQNRKFKEKFIEIETSGRTLQDETGEESIEVIKGNKKLEIIYIMQP